MRYSCNPFSPHFFITVFLWWLYAVITGVYFISVYDMKKISKRRFLVPYLLDNKIYYALISPAMGHNHIEKVCDNTGKNITEFFHTVNGIDRKGVLATPQELFDATEIVIHYTDGTVLTFSGDRCLTEIKDALQEKSLITGETEF